MLNPPELLLIDGTAMLFRAYFSGYKFQTPKGTEVGAVILVAKRLQNIISRQNSSRQNSQADRIALVFDAGHRTFRHEIDTSYKGQRDRPPDDLRPQFDIVRGIAVQLGLACFCVRGFEADDLMATLSAHGRRLGYRCRMMSADKDLYQLIQDGSDGLPTVTQMIPKTQEHIDTEAVIQRTGVHPSQIIDYMALVGDTCDNIPGVRGIGPKTATALLQHFTSLDEIYTNIDKISALPIRGARSVQERLMNAKADALKARTLVTLRDDVDVGISPETILNVTRWSGPRGQSADLFFKKLGYPEPLHRLRKFARWRFRNSNNPPEQYS